MAEAHNSFFILASARLRARMKCSIERGRKCIPLESDPTCQACIESDREQIREAKPINKGRG